MRTKRKLKINPNKLVIVTDNKGSKGSKALADKLSEKLGYRVWRVSADRVKGRKTFEIKPGTAKDVQLTAFANNDVNCPDFTRDISVAREWIAGGASVMCRTLLRASEGRGIVVADTVEQLVPAGLYTKYVKKKQEFRVHVLNGEVIDVQVKRKRRGFEGERDTKVRNLANGYVFCRDNLVEPDGLRAEAIKATAALGYQMGAVDVAYNERNNNLVVLEVNAQPGLQGTTVETYANAIVKGLK